MSVARPRSSLAQSSGLPTPGSRRKSNIGASPMASPSKGNEMAELQAAIRRRDPASYAGSRPSSVLSQSGNNGDDDAVEEVLASPEASPRRPAALMNRPSMSRPSTLRKPSSSAFRANVEDSPAWSGTPTTPGQRPPSSLSSSSYMSANTHASASLSRARTPATQFATPARGSARPSDMGTGGFLSTSTRTKTPRASSAFAMPSTSATLHPEVGDNVRALGMEGVLRYIGDVQFKPGTWAGIQLTGQYEGRGKNDGTVQGVQYFACAENCGIFVQAAKVESSMPPPPLPTARPSSSLGQAATGPTPRKPMPRPSIGGALVAPSTVTRAASKSSTEASQAAAARITAGSRASSYLNLTAKDLRAMRDGEKSAPARAGSSSPTKLAASTASSSGETSGVTPKPVRTSRPSVGGATAADPSAATPGAAIRKSFGGPGTPTPASSLRRPASSMRSHTPDIPSVPPIPAGLASSIAKDPGTPSAARRYSQLSRPSTPSARPSSRMSNVSGMRSVSRASSRASLASGTSSRLGHHRDDLGTSTTHATSSAPHDPEELLHTREALQRATREAEQAKLELLEMTQDLKEERKRAKALHIEVNELKRQAASSRLDEASAVDSRAEEAEKHASALAEMHNEIDSLKSQLEAVRTEKSESEASSAARIAGADAAERAREAAERERVRLEAELGSLQSAGRQAIEIYQDKVDALEAQLFEQEAATAAARAEARSATSALAASTSAAISPRLDDSPEALLAASMSASGSAQRDQAQESALAIENDSLKSELEHTKTRFNRLEEELEEAKYALEQEAEKATRRGKESLELAERLKKELKEAKDSSSKLRAEKEELSAKSRELEAALAESRHTLEAERGEIELLRKESGDRSARQERSEDATGKDNQLLLETQRDRDDARAETDKLRSDLEALQEELKLMEELRASDEAQAGSPMKEHPSQLQAQLEAKDGEIKALRAKLAQETLPSISTEPTDTDTVLDSYNSSMDLPASPNSLSPVADLRKKRDSNTSVSSHGSHGSRVRSPIKGAEDKLADEVRGFKILLEQANAENSRLSATNQDLVHEAAKLKDAQRALEKTVAGLLDQLDEQSPVRGGARSPAGQRTLGQDTLEAEVAELKKRLRDVERGYEKEKQALNSEVAQLESLVEAKIFKEDELEQQLSDAKKALADLKSRSSAAPEKMRDTKATIRAASTSNGRRSASVHSESEDDDGKCELCGDPHGIEDCPIFAGSAISPEIQQDKAYPKKPAGNQPYCDDCEEYGHDLENCPLANEVF